MGLGHFSFPGQKPGSLQLNPTNLHVISQWHSRPSGWQGAERPTDGKIEKKQTNKQTKAKTNTNTNKQTKSGENMEKLDRILRKSEQNYEKVGKIAKNGKR